MTSEQIQIKQLKSDIAKVEAKLEKLRTTKIGTGEQNAIGLYDIILSDLKGQLKWWQRRAEANGKGKSNPV